MGPVINSIRVSEHADKLAFSYLQRYKELTVFKHSTISNNVVAQVAQILTYVTGLRAGSYAEFIAVHLNSVKVFRRTFEAVEFTKFDFRMEAVTDIPQTCV